MDNGQSTTFMQEYGKLQIIWRSLSAIVHFAFTVIFFFTRVYPMFYLNIISTALYVALILRNITHKDKGMQGVITDCMAITELVAHQIVAVAMLGLSCGFQYYLIIAAIQILQLNTRKPARVRKIACATLVTMIFLVLTVWCQDYVPLYHLNADYEQIMSFFLIGSALVGILIYVYISFKINRSYREELESLVDARTSKIRHIQRQIMYSMADIIEERDNSTGGHVKRTSAYVKLIMLELYRTGVYKDELTVESMSAILAAAPLHDIGKIAIRDAILCKEGKLTENEYEVIKTHTSKGCAIVETALSGVEEAIDVKAAKDITKYHHERWDGGGYPEGLSGTQIPLSARIMAIADVFDALCYARVYKAAFSYDETFAIMESGRGTQFDPQVLDAFLAVRDKIIDVCENMKTGVDPMDFSIDNIYDGDLTEI